MTSTGPWSPPDASAPPPPSAPPPGASAAPRSDAPGLGTGLPPAGPPAAGALNFAAGAPLGGTAPTVTPEVPRSDRRELVLTAFLLVAAIVAGAASMMSWRDFGRRFGASATETGWERLDGSLGRGWLFVALGVLLATSGVLIASGRARVGRVLASSTGVLLVVAAIAEWGLGSDAARTGPGLGLWVELTVGVLVVIAVGVLGPKDPDVGS
jgi:hypothetical protein